VVQIEPGPIPTFTASAPFSTRNFAASPVAMLPTTTSRLGKAVFTSRNLPITPSECPCAVSITIASTPASTNAEGLVPNNHYNRYNFTFRNSWDVIKDVLELDFSLLYVKQNTRNGIGQGMYYNPLVPTYLFPPSDDINRYAVYEMYNPVRNFKTQNWPYGNLGLGMQNPFWIVNRNKFETNRERFIASFSARWNITSWLNILGRARMDNAYTDFERKLYASTDGLFSKPAGNWMTQDDKNTSVYLDFLLKKEYNIQGIIN